MCRHKKTALLECVIDVDRECAGKMAVARPGKAERVGLLEFHPRPRFQPRSNAGQGLDGRGDFGTGEAVIAMPALDLNAEQPAFHKFR